MKKKFLYISFLSIIVTSLAVFAASIFKPSKKIDEPNKIKTNPNISIPITPGKKPSDFSAVDNLLIALGVFEGQDHYQSNGYGEVNATGAVQSLHDQTYYHNNNLIVSNISIGTFSKIVEQHYQNLKKDAFLVRSGKMPSGKTKADDANWSKKQPYKYTRSEYNDLYGVKYQSYTPFILNKNTILNATQVTSDSKTIISAELTPYAADFYKRVIWTQGKLGEPPVYSKITLQVEIDDNWVVSQTKTNTKYQVQVGIIKSNCYSELLTTFTYDDYVSDYFTNYYSDFVKNIDDIISPEDEDNINPSDVITKIFSDNINLRIATKNPEHIISYLAYSSIVDGNGELQRVEVVLDVVLLNLQAKIIINQQDINKSQIYIKKNNSNECEKISFADFKNLDSELIFLIDVAVKNFNAETFLNNFKVSKTPSNIKLSNNFKGFEFEIITDLSYKLERIVFKNQLFTTPFDEIVIIPVVYRPSFNEDNLVLKASLSDAVKNFLITKKIHIQNLYYQVNDKLSLDIKDLAIDLDLNRVLANVIINYAGKLFRINITKIKSSFYLSLGEKINIKLTASQLLSIFRKFLSPEDSEKVKKILLLDLNYLSLLTSQVGTGAKVNLLPIIDFINKNFINANSAIKLNHSVSNETFKIDKDKYQDGKAIVDFVNQIITDYLEYKTNNSLHKSFAFTVNTNMPGLRLLSGTINIKLTDSYAFIINIDKINNIATHYSLEVKDNQFIIDTPSFAVKDSLVNLKALLNAFKNNDVFVALLPSFLISNNISETDALLDLINKLTLTTTNNSFQLGADLGFINAVVSATINGELLNQLEINLGDYQVKLLPSDKLLDSPVITGKKVFSLDPIIGLCNNNTIMLDNLTVLKDDYRITINNLLLDLTNKYLTAKLTISSSKFTFSTVVAVDSDYIYCQINDNHFKFKTKEILRLLTPVYPKAMRFTSLLSFDLKKILLFFKDNVPSFSSNGSSNARFSLGNFSNPVATPLDTRLYLDATAITTKITRFIVSESKKTSRLYNYEFNLNIGNDNGVIQGLFSLDLSSQPKVTIYIQKFRGQDINLYLTSDFSNHNIIFNNKKYSFTNKTFNTVISYLKTNAAITNPKINSFLDFFTANPELLNVNHLIKRISFNQNTLELGVLPDGVSSDIAIALSFTTNKLFSFLVRYGQYSLLFTSSNNHLALPEVTTVINVDELTTKFLEHKQIGISYYQIKVNDFNLEFRNFYLDLKQNILQTDLLVTSPKVQLNLRVVIQNNNLYFVLHNDARVAVSLSKVLSLIEKHYPVIADYKWLFSLDLNTYINYIADNYQTLFSSFDTNTSLPLNISVPSIFIPQTPVTFSTYENLELLEIPEQFISDLITQIKQQKLSYNLRGLITLPIKDETYLLHFDVNLLFTNTLRFSGKIAFFYNGELIETYFSYDENGLAFSFYDKKFILTTDQLHLITSYFNYELLPILNDVLANNALNNSQSSNLSQLFSNSPINLNLVISKLRVLNNHLNITINDELNLDFFFDNNVQLVLNYQKFQGSLFISKTQNEVSPITNCHKLDNDLLLLVLNGAKKLLPVITSKKISFNNLIYDISDNFISCYVALDFETNTYYIEGLLRNRHLKTDFALTIKNKKYYLTLFNKLKIVLDNNAIFEILQVVNNHYPSELLSQIVNSNNNQNNNKLQTIITKALDMILLQDKEYHLIKQIVRTLFNSYVLHTSASMPAIEEDSYSQIDDLVPIINKGLSVYKNGDFISFLDDNYQFKGNVKHELNPQGEIVPGGYLLFDFDFTTAITYVNSRYQFGATGYIKDHTRGDKRYEISLYLNDNKIYFQFDLFKTIISVNQIHVVVEALIKELGFNHPALNYLQKIDLETFNTSLTELFNSTTSSQIDLNKMFALLTKNKLAFKAIINQAFLGGKQNQDLTIEAKFSNTNYLDTVLINNIYTNNGEFLSFSYTSISTHSQSAVISDELAIDFKTYDAIEDLIVGVIKFYKEKNYHLVGRGENKEFAIRALAWDISYTDLNVLAKFVPIVNGNNETEYELNAYISYKLDPSPILTAVNVIERRYNEMELFIKGKQVYMKWSYQTWSWFKWHKHTVEKSFSLNTNGEELANNISDMLCFGSRVRSEIVNELKNKPIYNQFNRKEIPPIDAFFIDYSYDGNHNLFQTTVDLERILKNDRMGNMDLAIQLRDDKLPYEIIFKNLTIGSGQEKISVTNQGFKIVSYNVNVPAMP